MHKAILFGVIIVLINSQRILAGGDFVWIESRDYSKITVSRNYVSSSISVFYCANVGDGSERIIGVTKSLITGEVTIFDKIVDSLTGKNLKFFVPNGKIVERLEAEIARRA